MARTFLRTALAVVVASLAIAAPALASGNVTVEIVGAGHVTGDGIDCTRTPGGVTSGTCTHFVDNVEGDAAQCHPAPPGCTLGGEQFLRAEPLAGAGFSFDSWTGFCARNDRCTIPIPITAGSDVKFTATFLDIQPPTASLTQPANGAAVAGRIPLTATAADNGRLAGVVFQVRGTVLPPLAIPPFTTNFDTQTLPDGPAAITVTAIDGNSHSTTSAATNVTIDNTKPTLTLTGPDGTTFGPGETAAWTIAAADATTGPPAVRCSVVEAGRPPAFGACTSAGTERVSNQPDGRYTLTVRATDRAGNFAEQARTFAVDTGPPETTITSGPDDGSSTDGATITWGIASSEPGSTFECRVFESALMPGPFGPCSSDTQHSASGLAPGAYTFEVRAKDALGNIDTSPAKRTLTILPAAVAGVSDEPAVVVLARPAVVNVTLTYHYRKLNARATTLDRLVVGSVPAGATVTVRCPKGCSKKRFVKVRASGKVSLKSLLKKPLKVKTVITVIVSKPGAVAAVKVLEIRSRKEPRITTLCLPAGVTKPRACA